MAQEAAARELGPRLSSGPEACAAAVAAGALTGGQAAPGGGVVGMLAGGTAAVKLSAAFLMTIFFAHGFAENVYQAGALPHLVALIRIGRLLGADETTQSAACFALSSLYQIAEAGNLQQNSAMVGAGVLPELVALLWDCTPPHYSTQQRPANAMWAALTIKCIAATSDDLMLSIINAGAVPALTQLLPNSLRKAIAAVTADLLQLSAFEPGRAAIIAAAALQPLQVVAANAGEFAAQNAAVILNACQSA